MIEILRLGHRIQRDKRISTHVALVSRAFGADRIFYSGQRDKGMEESVLRIVGNFGGDFSISHVNKISELVKGKTVVHLTMYGADFREYVDKIQIQTGINLCIVIYAIIFSVRYFGSGRGFQEWSDP